MCCVKPLTTAVGNMDLSCITRKNNEEFGGLATWYFTMLAMLSKNVRRLNTQENEMLVLVFAIAIICGDVKDQCM